MEMQAILASRWKRLGGALIDTLISLAVTLPVMFASGIFVQFANGKPMTLGQTLFYFCYAIAAYVLINGYLLAKHGQTVGKRIAGTRIVSNTDGNLCSLGCILGLRVLPIALITQIPFIGGLLSIIDSLFVFRNDKRCIHDLIAGTRVVDTQLVPVPEPTTIGALEAETAVPVTE